MLEKISQTTNNSGEVPPAYQEFAAFKGQLIPYEYEPVEQSPTVSEQPAEASESYAERQEQAAQKEADNFLKYHKDILNKKPEDITLDTIDADEAAANKAISAWAGLSEMARDLLYAKNISNVNPSILRLRIRDIKERQSRKAFAANQGINTRQS